MSNPFFNPLANSMNKTVGQPQSLLNSLVGNPQGLQVLSQAQAMLRGKSPMEQQTMVMQLAKQQGIDIEQLRQLAGQFGFRI